MASLPEVEWHTPKSTWVIHVTEIGTTLPATDLQALCAKIILAPKGTRPTPIALHKQSPIFSYVWRVEYFGKVAVVSDSKERLICTIKEKPRKVLSSKEWGPSAVKEFQLLTIL